MDCFPKILILGMWSDFQLSKVPFFKYLTKNYGAQILTHVTNNTHIDLIIVSVFGYIPEQLKHVTTLFLAYEDYQRWAIDYHNPYHTDVDFAIVNNDPEKIPFSNRLKKAISMSLASIWYHPIKKESIYFKEGRQDLRVEDKKEFCSFVFGNADMGNEGVKYRTELFQELSKYKEVHSRGGFLNNSNNNEKAPMDKVEYKNWNSKYKFTICIENMFQPMYTTEKILLPYRSGSIPIYNSDPRVLEFINPKSLVFCHNKSYNDVVKEIIELDTDDHKYQEMLREPPFVNNVLPDFFNVESGYRLLDDVMLYLGFDRLEKEN